jgi:hypothetical protein
MVRRKAPPPPKRPELGDRLTVLKDLVYASAQANTRHAPGTREWAKSLRATADYVIEAMTSERDCRTWVDDPISSADARVLMKWFEAETDWR